MSLGCSILESGRANVMQKEGKGQEQEFLRALLVNETEQENPIVHSSKTNTMT